MESCGINVFETVDPEIILEKSPRYKVWQVGLVCSRDPLVRISCSVDERFCKSFYIKDGLYHCDHHHERAIVTELINEKRISRSKKRKKGHDIQSRKLDDYF